MIRHEVKSRISKLVAAAALLGIANFAPRAHANQCIGYVSNVEVFRDGNLMVRLVGSSSNINRGIVCNTINQLGSVPASVCRSWVTTFHSGALAGREVALWLSGAQTCIRTGTTNLSGWADSVWLL